MFAMHSLAQTRLMMVGDLDTIYSTDDAVANLHM
jgi:hypothetical protein